MVGRVLPTWQLFLISASAAIMVPVMFLLSNLQRGISFQTSQFANIPQFHQKSEPPEVSGWIAWWAEEPAYQLVENNPGKVTSVSPVWFRVNEELILENVGQINRPTVIAALKEQQVKILPSIGSELSGDKLSPLFNDSNKQQALIADLITQLVELGVDGVDVDLEGIAEADKQAFTQFLTDLDHQLADHDMDLAVAIHAQTPILEWEGTKGQDIDDIADIADEVRIMTYDYHSSSSDPGAISPLNWMREVAIYNAIVGEKDKIVIGLPSYGYVWETAGDKRGLQFDEFHDYLSSKQFSSQRDFGSGELVVTNDNFTGWLSDSEAMVKKVTALRSLGFNRFIIWHLGGMDEAFFAQDWTSP